MLIKCCQIIHSWKLEDGLVIVEKEKGVYVQCMLEMSRCLYTGGNFEQDVGENG